jgi:hypothetical protein
MLSSSILLLFFLFVAASSFILCTNPLLKQDTVMGQPTTTQKTNLNFCFHIYTHTYIHEESSQLCVLLLFVEIKKKTFLLYFVGKTTVCAFCFIQFCLTHTNAF